MREKTLLVGNGVNRLSRGTSWINLLRNLIQDIGKENAIRFVNEKPLTLLYEEIFYRSKKYLNMDELDIKRKIANQIKLMEPNSYHQEFLKSKIKNIITTNYDYNFEKSYNIPYTSDTGERSNLLKETKYNLFRRRRINDKYIWHIHGEVDAPNSITLGHEHYSGFLQKMRNYVFGHLEIRNERKKSPILLNNINFDNDDNNIYSWVDLFLRDDVHIIGFSLDYVEIDLWWLILLKERLKLDKDLTLGNTHYYFNYKNEIEPKDKAKLDLLESLGIKIHREKVIDSYREIYGRFLRTIN